MISISLKRQVADLGVSIESALLATGGVYVFFDDGSTAVK